MSNREDTTRLVIDAAALLFARQGFNGTSTREIAKLAGVRESTIFRHFPTKQGLFWAALQSQLDMVHPSKELQTILTENRSPKVVLPMIVEFFVHLSTYRPDLLRFLGFSLLEFQRDAELMSRRRLGPLFELIHGCFARWIERGEMCRLDPTILTMAFTTSIVSHRGLLEALGNSKIPFVSAEEVTNAYACFWVEALCQNAAAVPSRPSAV